MPLALLLSDLLQSYEGVRVKDSRGRFWASGCLPAKLALPLDPARRLRSFNVF
jgi:hypothetical protein